MEALIIDFNGLVDAYLTWTLQERASDIESCSEGLRSLKQGLGQFNSKHTSEAHSILDGVLKLIKSATEAAETAKSKRKHGDWERDARLWKQKIAGPLSRATALRAHTVAQPGQAFGASVTAVLPQQIGPSDSTYTQVLQQRHQTLLITRATMQGAQETLAHSKEMHLAAQHQILELAGMMKEIDHRKAATGPTIRVFKKAVDVLVKMQSQMRQLASFFHSLAVVIDTTSQGHAKRFLKMIDNGIEKRGDHFAVAYTEQQVNSIRETLILLRGHFAFVVTSADMYQEIAAKHINPCIRVAAELSLSASPDEQDEMKKTLKEVTDASSQDIKRIAEREVDAYHRALQTRVEEIESELGSRKWPVLEYDGPKNERAIKEGVKESGRAVEQSIKGGGSGL